MFSGIDGMMVTPGFRDLFARLQSNVEKFVLGNSEAVRLALICFLAQGHLLIEGVPGVAKTSLAKAIAGSVAGDLRRVQFTPDVLPTDITGVEIFNPQTAKFEWRPGPVFTNILIGDEINRASPKTQAALLQAMGERSVTIGLETLPLPPLFFCVATQNPVEHHGTYPLPEAQLDRFLMRIVIDYPAPDYEQQVIAQEIIAAQHDLDFEPRRISPVTNVDEVTDLARWATQVMVGRALRDYVVSIVTATRSTSTVKLGASPRAAIALARAAQVAAASRGRDLATPDDVKAVAKSVLAHRLQLTHEASMQDTTAEMVVQDILDTTPVPRDPGEPR